ncbi:MAG: hypothetical protein DI533_10110 [Cereibacter sphaeroides]|uniref:DUF11 domain-containing protein n=1 Tax=Cereibacter sphaeroides TaxID=1063 RepID=A0A2W5USX2_CERSP|nr:MAG: hypothetical protein DI533_10110 [Cereibacter sphaeroides]
MIGIRGLALAGAIFIGFAQQASAQAVQYDWVVNIRNEDGAILPAGSTAGYVVTVFNDSLVAAPPTTINIPIPAGTTWVGSTGDITNCAEVVSGTVTCDVPALGADAIATLTIDFLTSAEGVISVTPVIPAVDADPGNNSETTTTTITRGADISLGLSGTTTAPAGGSLSYTFTATNNGPYPSEGFTLEFPIPTGFSSIDPPAGCTLSGSSYMCAIPGTVPVGGTVDVTFTGVAGVGANSTITVSGAVGDGSPPDPDNSNDTASFNTIITAGSDVSVGKSRSPAGPLVVGDTVTFTLDPRYTGDVPNGLTLSDTIPSNYQIISVTPAPASGWTCSTAGQQIDCSKPSGSVPGSNVSLGQIVVVAEAVSPGSAVNTVEVGATNPFDPDLSNNTDDDGGAVIAAATIDLAIHKSGPQPPLVVVGNSYDYTLNTSNLGNTGYYGTVRIVDTVPAGLEVTAVGGPGWTCGPTPPLTGLTIVTCERVYTQSNPLPPGGTTPDITMTTTVTQSGPINNGAEVIPVNGNLPDANLGNNTTNVGTDGSEPGDSADIRVLKSAQNTNVIAGEEQVYRLEVVNDGPVPSLNIVLTDQLSNLINNEKTGPDAGYVSISTDPGVAQGLACSTDVTGPQSLRQTCNIGQLPVCVAGTDCPVIVITVRPGSNGGSRTNTVVVGSQSTADPNLNNNSASATYTVEARADVSITKTATPSPVPAGQNLVYVITAQNLENGLSVAENVTISDTLAPNLVFLSATPSSGSCSSAPTSQTVTGPGNDQLLCNLGTLSNGAQQTVTVTVRPTQSYFGNSITNTATVSTTTTETDPTNNSASVVTPVEAPAFDLLIQKTDSIDPVAVGEDAVYTLRIANRGPSAAENVVVTDTLPATRLSYQSLTFPSDATCSTSASPNVVGGSFTCTFPYLQAQTTRDILLTMRGTAKGVTVNNAQVEADGSLIFDTERGNNITSQTTTVRTRADVAVTAKTPSNATPNVSEALTYTIRVANLPGPLLAEADGVVLNDSLPSGMVLTGSPTAALIAGTATSLACTGAAGNTTFNCNFGTFSTGGLIDVTVPVRVNSITASPQTFVNTATVSTTSLDINLNNDSNSGTIEVRGSSLAGLVFRDFNDNGTFDANDTGINGITMTLSGTDLNGSAVTRTATTGAGGAYTFTLLPQGTYTVTQGSFSEAHLTAQSAIPGTSGGTSGGPTIISSISLQPLTDATGYLFPKVPQARIGLAKAVSGAATVAPDGSVSVTFLFNVRNFSLEPLQGVTLTDQLAGSSPLFGAHSPAGPLTPGTYRVTSIGGSCGGKNNNFNGSGDLVLLSALTMAQNSTCNVTVSLLIQPTVPLPPEISPNVRYRNQGTVQGTGAWTGQTPATNPQLTDPSTNGTNPDPNGNGIANENGENQPTPVPVPFDPEIGLIKTADASAIGEPDVGDIITYAFTVTNTGNVTLTNVTLTDMLPGIMISGGPIPVLLPGASDGTTFTATYALTQADLNAGQVENQATATGTWGVDGGGNPLTVDDLSGTHNATDDPTIVNLGTIELVKSVDLSALSTPPAIGDTVTFGFAITNTGPTVLRNITISDPMPGLVLTGGPIATLASGATDTTTFVGTYLLTGADIDAGVISNTATVTGDYAPDGNGGFLQVTDDSSTSSNLVDEPLIALIKRADSSALSDPPVAGDVISYAFTVTNTGNVTLTNVTLTDILPNIVISGGPIPILASGAADSTTFTATYALTQADIDAGRVENQATVTGTFNDPVTGPELVTDVSGTDNTNDTPTVVPLEQDPSISLVKAADASGVSNPAVVGEQISYSFTITNTGNITLNDITLSDLLPAIVISGGPIATLVPGASDSATFTATYALTQDDLDAGQVQNQATTIGNYIDPDGNPGTVEDISGTDQNNDAPTVVPLGQGAAIALVKTVDASGLSSPVQIGDTLTYTFAVTNTGNVTLTNVTLTDILPGILITGGPIPVLPVGATDSTTFTATYALIQADLDAARVENQATATGTYTTPGGDDSVSDLSGATVDDDDPTVVDLVPSPEIRLIKTVDVTSLPDPAHVGDEVSYAFAVTNTGNVTLTNVTLADSLPDIMISGGPIAALPPGATDSTTFTARYPLTQADLDTGQVTNTAIVTGTYVDSSGTPGTTTDTSGTDIDNDTPTDVIVPSHPAIAVVKTADVSRMSTPSQVGDPITYNFAVTNTGNVTLTNVTLSDPLPGLTLTGGPIATLAPGQTDTTTFVGRYNVVEGDFNAEQVRNQATATGSPPIGPDVTDLSGATVEDDDPTIVPLTFQPNVTATKTASTDRVIIGDSLSYTLTFTSNAPGTLRNVTVVDVLPVGLVYTPGTATIDGTAQEPQVTGRTLRWTGQTIAANGTLTVKLGVRVTGSAPWGKLENQSWLNTSGGDRISNVATAVVLREPEQVFDCSDIIGKVFDDRNSNGYQDEPKGGAEEPGLPGVRVVTTRGYIVTTDEFGRFHVPCAELPKTTGSNFTMKLDTRSLPTGYRVTTENPRTIRVTPGKMAKLNFGVSLSRVVRVDLSAQAFTEDGKPTAALKKGVAGLVAQMQVEPSVLRLNYRLAGETDAVARKRLEAVEALIRNAWHGDGYRLKIERTLQRGGVKK